MLSSGCSPSASASGEAKQAQIAQVENYWYCVTDYKESFYVLVSVRRQYARRVRTGSAELKAVANRDHALLIPPNILMGGERLLHGCITHHEVSHSMITIIVFTIIIIIKLSTTL